MITRETCQIVMDAYRHGDFTGWTALPDGSHRIGLGDVGELRHTTDGFFNLVIGNASFPVREIEWRCSIHIHFDGGELIPDKEDA